MDHEQKTKKKREKAKANENLNFKNSTWQEKKKRKKNYKRNSSVPCQKAFFFESNVSEIFSADEFEKEIEYLEASSDKIKVKLENIFDIMEIFSDNFSQQELFQRNKNQTVKKKQNKMDQKEATEKYFIRKFIVKLQNLSDKPKRYRRKPLKYWKSERIIYENNQALKEVSVGNFYQLIGIESKKERVRIEKNIHSQEVKAKISIRPFQVLQSEGFCHPFSKLVIKIDFLPYSNYNFVYFDGKEFNRVKENDVLFLFPLTPFTLKNKNNRKVTLTISLIL